MPVQLALLNELMGMVPNASEIGATISHTLEFCHWFMLILFIGWSSYFLYALMRFHHTRNPKASYHGVKSKISAHLEFSVIVVEAALLLGFALPLWGRRVTDIPDSQKASAQHVKAIGRQFGWDFLYPGPDGIFGRQDPRFVSAQNPFGLDPDDPHGKDDLYDTNELHIVNYRAVEIEVTSKDVIHSLAMEHMRMMQDAIPGTRVPIWFTPIKEGQYEIICAQLCGNGHAGMKAQLYVESPAKFAAYQSEKMTMQHPGLAKPAAEAPAPKAP